MIAGHTIQLYNMYRDDDTSWPESVHDSRIFENSTIYQQSMSGDHWCHMRSMVEILEGLSLAMRSSTFALRHSSPKHAQSRPSTPKHASRETYNRIYKTARNTVNRTFVQSKGRFLLSWKHFKGKFGRKFRQ